MKGKVVERKRKVLDLFVHACDLGFVAWLTSSDIVITAVHKILKPEVPLQYVLL